MSQEKERDQRPQEFNDGLRNVTQGVISGLFEISIVAKNEEFTYEPAWKLGRSVPEAIKIRVAPKGAPTVSSIFSKEQIEDCWNGLDRADVRQKIRAIAAEYLRLRGS